MRPTILLLFVATASASWFTSKESKSSPPSSWSNEELTSWLEAHNIPVPNAPTPSRLQELVKSNWDTAATWTQEQLSDAQRAFADMRDASFDAWDESRLRSLLLQQGVIAPKGPREKLVRMAQVKYKAYQDAAGRLAEQATVIYDVPASAIGSAAAEATDQVSRKLEDSKDYVYSTWDDNQLRDYLQEKGVLSKTQPTKREEMLNLMKSAYSAIANPIWEAWSTSYLHEWLTHRGLIKPDATKNREALTEKMKLYYYDANDSAWHAWNDSDLKAWLVDHNIVKSDAQVSHDKMVKLVSDNYFHAKDSFWSAWSDNQLRTWLVDHGYIRSNAQLKRDEMIKIANQKWTDASSRSSAYLQWPDARLRAYLRQKGVSEEHLPTSRPGLLQETRIRWVETKGNAANAYETIKEVVGGAVGGVGRMLGIVQERAVDTADDVKDSAQKGGEYAQHKAGEGKDFVEQKGGKAASNAQEKYAEGKRKVAESTAASKESLKSEL